MTTYRTRKLAAILILLCGSPSAWAQPDSGEIVSPETLEALDNLELVTPPEEDQTPPPNGSATGSEITALTIEQLATQSVEVASGLSESLMNAPGSIVVITALDIEQRGYTSIDEVFEDLPGFDVAKGRGTEYATVYQRGYRTPFTQRFLFLVDGQVDNHLWTHEAELTRQYPMSNIERIEVLYGPASAVYGPNAFAGIVNVVTRDGRGLADGEAVQRVDLQAGSWDTYSIDGAVRARSGDWSMALSGRFFTSDEPDLSGKWGFADNALYGDEQIWGPILDLETADEPLGRYRDRTDDQGLLGSVSYQSTKLGVILWRRSEGYGPYYAADRVQNNALWNKTSRQVYLEHEAELLRWLSGRTLLLARDNTVGGDWVEAQPDTDPGMERFSYISKTRWYSESSSLLARQTFEASVTPVLGVSGGLKYERKRLTKRYDIPGYYDAYSSQGTADDPGPYGLGSHVGHSSDADYVLPPHPIGSIPSDNVAITHDVGGFLQAIFDQPRFRVSAGARLDHNSVYGGTFNPRVTGIWKLGDEDGAIKLLYGEAFQEPAPIQLWGGWSGRLANPNLDPEKVRNVEAVFLYRTERTLHQTSAFYAHYDDVIKEEAENAGQRDITGLEYSARVTLPNPIPKTRDLHLWGNASYTVGWASQRYNHASSEWVDDTIRIGDIAPIKANLGVNLPLPQRLALHLRANVVGERRLYARNPLRDGARPGGERRIDPYLTLNANLAYDRGPFRLAVKLLNLLDADYFHPGVEAASSGDDFTQRSLGFQSSLLPQAGRSVFVTLTVRDGL